LLRSCTSLLTALFVLVFVSLSLHDALPICVIVPFGKGNRRVQGFITAIKDNQIFDGELKEISNIMDLEPVLNQELIDLGEWMAKDRKSTRLNSSHVSISYAVFCLKKKTNDK